MFTSCSVWKYCNNNLSAPLTVLRSSWSLRNLPVWQPYGDMSGSQPGGHSLTFQVNPPCLHKSNSLWLPKMGLLNWMLIIWSKLIETWRFNSFSFKLLIFSALTFDVRKHYFFSPQFPKESKNVGNHRYLISCYSYVTITAILERSRLVWGAATITFTFHNFYIQVYTWSTKKNCLQLLSISVARL